MADINFSNYRNIINNIVTIRAEGKVSRVIGLTIEVEGLKSSVGEVCHIYGSKNAQPILSEVVGFKEGGKIILMPLGDLKGIGPGSSVKPTGKMLTVKIGDELLGKVLDGLGNPIEDDCPEDYTEYPVNNSPPNPLKRPRIDKIMATGVKAIDGFLTCGEGQRVGIFAGSGVGKSTLLGMISRYSDADINVIGLVGERGREVRDFLEKDLGEDGLKRSIIVCATSDQPALVRLKGAYTATAIAEYFRDKGKKVMLMMDSVTRFAMAQREVGLAIGEPPATKGYTPSVFAALPGLLERSGMSEKGSITAFYTVLVDGDDFNEPISDAVRGILDGHIILSRELAAQNHYPSIDILRSISRLMAEIVPKDHRLTSGELRNLLSTYRNSEDLINIGAYVKGSNPSIDKAIKYINKLNGFLQQDKDVHVAYETIMKELYGIAKE
ncbi:putative ATP synthase YscN [Oxobacter pfennigii]|uniref:Putative ATP synthase YscN n=1 Tax=Oxobacter pfennigii TaxID=36849 RepID=A0A0P8WAF4_9CLOT|nr:flagellar protein export ATPase FliI [Oxobacter pfennigii]KPU44690.1 putative ATP synthase YscN [Oxobacter pfennigii]